MCGAKPSLVCSACPSLALVVLLNVCSHSCVVTIHDRVFHCHTGMVPHLQASDNSTLLDTPRWTQTKLEAIASTTSTDRVFLCCTHAGFVWCATRRFMFHGSLSLVLRPASLSRSTCVLSIVRESIAPLRAQLSFRLVLHGRAWSQPSRSLVAA
jgi:hypothetical protein